MKSMPRKPDPDLFDETADLVADNEKLWETVVNLESQLRKRTQDAKRLADALKTIRGTPRPELFLIIIAVLMAGRMALYLYADRSSMEAMIASLLLGGAAAAMLILWTAAEWRAARWLMIPKTVLLLVAFVIAAEILASGMQWIGEMTGWVGVTGPPRVAAWRAFKLALGALLLAALPLCGWLVNLILNLLTEPVETVKGMFGR
jgi:hypothetical protein